MCHVSCDDEDLGLALDPGEETVALAVERAAATAILEAEAVAAAEAHRQLMSTDVYVFQALFHVLP